MISSKGTLVVRSLEKGGEFVGKVSKLHTEKIQCLSTTNQVLETWRDGKDDITKTPNWNKI